MAERMRRVKKSKKQSEHEKIKAVPSVETKVAVNDYPVNFFGFGSQVRF